MAEKPAIIARRFRSRNLQHIIASVTDYDALRRDDDRGLFSHLDSSMGIHPGPCTAASGDIGIDGAQAGALIQARRSLPHPRGRSEEHTSELQSLMRTSYAVFCLKKKNTHTTPKTQQPKNPAHDTPTPSHSATD